LNTKTAIIFAQQAQVKSAPTSSGEVNFELHEGTKVFILEKLDNWVKIKIADGKIGWIEEEDIKEL
jgi:SH3-like domain-containing protein